MKTLQILLCTTLLTAGTYAQETTAFNRAKMDSLFAIIEKHDNGMGSISIFENGEEVYHRAFGYAVLEDSIRATMKTKYRIGSITKSFTAAMIMQLVDGGKLALDATLGTWFPDLPNADQITVEHLLRHRSGLYNFTNAPEYTTWMVEPKTRSEMLDIISGYDPDFVPGERTAYSNTNYVLLSYIAEEIEGKPYAEILDERIVQPLDLDNTYYGGKIDPADDEAQSYQMLGGWQPAPETDLSIPTGAGGIVSTPADLNTFFHALLTGQVVSDSALTQMKTISDRLGMGLVQFPFFDKSAYGHTGGIDGFQSNAAHIPEENVTIAYVSNAVDLGVNAILIGTLSIYFGRDYDLPDFTPALELTSEDLDPYLGVYSAPDFPLKVTITKEGNALIAQAAGQPPFQLTPTAPHQFKYDPAVLKLEFLPDEDKMILKQGGGEFTLTKE